MMIIDFLGTIASLLATYLFIQRKTSAWKASLVACSINGWLYYQKGIYADAALECVYFLSSCYGWYLWTLNPNSIKQNLHRLTLKQVYSSVMLCPILYILIYWFLTTKMHSTIPGLDALTTVLSLLAQLLMCYRSLLTWVVWFFCDGIYAYLYWQKQLPIHTFLMLIYVFLAGLGYWQWSKKDKAPRHLKINMLNGF